jgi:predicted GIY-YIG superfamily endonuclease
VELKYLEELPDRSSAQQRENAIKKLTRKKKLQLVETYHDEVG